MKQMQLTHEEIGALCLSLAHLFHGGIGEGDAFALLAEDEREASRRALLDGLSRRADEGLPLAENLRQAGCFPAYVCALLTVGQQVGRTEETLESLARYYEGRGRMERQLRRALLYPGVLLAVLLTVVGVLLVAVLPVFNDVYAQLGGRLTGLAGGLLALGMALRKGLPLLCVLLGLIAAAVLTVALCPHARTRLTALWRNIRGDKGIRGQVTGARFAQALALAVGSGMAAEEAVTLASTLAEGSPGFEERCRRCRQSLAAGATLAEALRESDLLPRAQCRLLEAGLRSGRGEAVMDGIARHLLEESEEIIGERVGRIEPALVVTMSLLVGVILLSVMLPLMHIMTSIG